MGQGAFSGIVASVMAGVLWPFLYFVFREFATRFEAIGGSAQQQGFWVAFLLLGTPCALVVALPVGILAGGAFALVFRRLQDAGFLQKRQGMALGAVAGALFGIAWVQLVQWSYGGRVFDPGADLLAGAAAGAVAGAWYGGRMTRWLSRPAIPGPT
jgi:hypothetical protein